MKKLIQGLGVGALLLASACYPTVRAGVTYHSGYRYGYGGSGLDMNAAENACRSQAAAFGWRLFQADRAEQTSAVTARIRFDAAGGGFRRHATCFYDSRSGLAEVR